MTLCLFASDLHGCKGRYAALGAEIRARRPAAVFLGGDLLPPGPQREFLAGWLIPAFLDLRGALGAEYPRVFVILGNDDRRAEEELLLEAETGGLWLYAHLRRLQLSGHAVYGYGCVPPTPFALKDWERYDVSRYVDPGSYAPEEGLRSVHLAPEELRRTTIQGELRQLAGDDDVSRAVFLFHSPPYDTALDRAALDRRSYEHAPLDVHVGSIAIRRFIEERQPLLTLHGHVHESARLTGAWRQRLGRTCCLSAAHDGPELALVAFELEDPQAARRELLPVQEAA